MLDEVLGRGWSLLGVGVAPDDWAAVHRPALAALVDLRVDVGLDDVTPHLSDERVALTDLDGRLQEAFAPVRGRCLLVRPDRIVAACFAPHDAAEVDAAVRRWLPGSPARPPATADVTTDGNDRRGSPQWPHHTPPAVPSRTHPAR
jgi:3-(3-hydroxy-phenyl)propionate hydroxylase